VLPKYANCRRCGSRINHAEGYSSVHFSEGKTTLEKLRNGKVICLCVECSLALRTYLGVPEVPPRPVVSPPGLPEPPVSLYWED
jgi:hypothetical protein